MKESFTCFFRYPILLILVLVLQVDLASASSVRLSGHVPVKAISDAMFLYDLDHSTNLQMTFVLPLRNKEALEELVQRIYDPTDEEHYGKYLTLEKFTERFAPTEEDYQKVIAYAENLGLIIVETHSNRTLLKVSGSSKSVEQGFNLRMHGYQKHNGRTFYAPNNDPEVPASIASIIHGIIGLDNHALRRTYNRRREAKEELITSSYVSSNAYPSGPGGGFAPKDLVTAYNLNTISANGSNQIIALFELGGYQESDINKYTSYFGLPAPKLKKILVDGGAGGGIDPEVTLDIELAIALAPASTIYVYEGPNSDQGVLHIYNQIATDNLAKQVSTSWGMNENFLSPTFLQAENAIFLQMAAHGQTVYAAAGDSGAYDAYPSNSILVVDDPASQPYVVGVGGTRLTVNTGNGAYASESVWNEGLGNGAGGGGISGFWPIPSWQKNVSTVTSKTQRNVPDVSLNADTNTGYSIYHGGKWVIYGGTSCAAPLWAAFTALVNQVRTAHQMPVLGFANPIFYSIGIGSSYIDNFHDVTMGNNLYYSASMGYDNASGWGSFNGANLIASLTESMPTPHFLPILNIALTHSGSFKKGGIGTYTIIIQNQGNAPTDGAVNVVVTLPKSLKYKSLSSSGWIIDKKTLICTRSNGLEAGASYPPITLRVNVGKNAPHSVTPTATVSGGGAKSEMTASNLTRIK